MERVCAGVVCVCVLHNNALTLNLPVPTRIKTAKLVKCFVWQTVSVTETLTVTRPVWDHEGLLKIKKMQLT